jgi:hypothetical protein
MDTLPRKDKQQGQALLIILLVLAVSLVLVLSTASRSVTDIQTTTLEEESLRAFNAAEAGVEEALINTTVGTFEDDFDDGTSEYITDVDYYDPIDGDFEHPIKISSGEVITFWFVDHDDDGNLTCGAGECFNGNNIEFCWGEADPENDYGSGESRPALQVTLYYDTDGNWGSLSSGDYSSVEAKRWTFDPDLVRRSENGFTAANEGCGSGGHGSGGGGSDSYGYSTDELSVTSVRPILARIKALYNTERPTAVRLETHGSPHLPPQGLLIDSTGGAGDSSRRIQVWQTYPDLPFIFDAAIYTQGGLTK